MLKNLSNPVGPAELLRLLAFASALILGAALFSQYAMGLKPCHLCLWQRVPYAALIALGIVGPLAMKSAKALRMLLMAAVLLLAYESGLALYHSAVERHIVAGPSDCTASATDHLSIEEMRAKILGAAVTRCDEPVWMVHGWFTMANANFVAAIFLLVFAWRNERRFALSESERSESKTS